MGQERRKRRRLGHWEEEEEGTRAGGEEQERTGAGGEEEEETGARGEEEEGTGAGGGEEDEGDWSKGGGRRRGMKDQRGGR